MSRINTRIIAELEVEQEVIQSLSDNEKKLKSYDIFLQDKTIWDGDVVINLDVVIQDMNNNDNDDMIVMLSDGQKPETVVGIIELVSEMKEAKSRGHDNLNLLS